VKAEDTEGGEGAERVVRAKFSGPYSELTAPVISCALRVHKALGLGFVESVYENALAFELEDDGIPYERQKQIKVIYRGREVGLHRLDLFVRDKVIVELEAKEAFCEADIATLLSYLRATGAPVALMLNFGTP